MIPEGRIKTTEVMKNKRNDKYVGKSKRIWTLYNNNNILLALKQLGNENTGQQKCKL